MAQYDEATPAGRLSSAIRLAAAAHRAQIDKIGEPYILHPIAVMMMVETINEKIVAVLHDTVEDTDVVLRTIRDLFGETVANAVDAMTRRTDETYMRFIKRCALNPLARTVKIADIKHNSSPDRVSRLPMAERLRLYDKYTSALNHLESVQ